MSALTIDEMRNLLQASLKPKRFRHSCAVYETALELARLYHADERKVAVAALLHDCGREVPTPDSVAKALALGLHPTPVECAQPVLLHAVLGPWFAREKYGVTDPDILEAIRRHTTGGAGMDDLAKVVFLADMTEPGRDFPGVEALREASRRNLDEAMLMAYENTIQYLLDQQLLIHPDAVAGYNELALARKEALAESYHGKLNQKTRPVAGKEKKEHGK
jgi:predicted HD superfamily hydrolase involved in NAD metabolism